MHDSLIEDNAVLRPENILDRAHQLSLIVDAFKQCIGSHRYDATIGEALAAGEDVGVEGTPTFLIAQTAPELHGYRIVGAVPFNILETQIDQILAPRASSSGRSVAATNVNSVQR
jgi:protein-disulfide isomerase